MHSLHFLCKNGRIHTEDRLTILLCELNDISWSVVAFSETRRLSSDVHLHGGHRLISSLSIASASGVVVLLHKNLFKQVSQIIYVNGRVMAVDLRSQGKVIRFIAV